MVAAMGVLLVVGLATAAAATQARAKATVLGGYRGRWGDQLVVEVNGQKIALFDFSKDSSGKSACYGKCARTWYPLIDRGQVVVANGSEVNRKRLRTFRRKDGSIQLEYWGQPLYRCRIDTKTRQTRGDGVYQYGGSWGLMGVQGSALAHDMYGGSQHVPRC